MTPVSLEDFSQKLQEWQTEWDKAEEYLKKAENINGEAISPSVWELRYSGRRISEVIRVAKEGGSASDIEKSLTDAIMDCHRAQHDAIDSSVAYMAKQLVVYINHFGDEIIYSKFERYNELRSMIVDIQSFCENSRRDRRDRAAIYQHVFSRDFPNCVEEFRKFEQKMFEARKDLKRIRQITALRELILPTIGTVAVCWFFYYLRGILQLPYSLYLVLSPRSLALPLAGFRCELKI